MMDPEAQQTGDPSAMLVAAAVDVIAELQPNQSTCGFLESLLIQPSSLSGSLCITGILLYPLASC